MGAVASLDAYQRGHRWVGLPLAVVYKYFDDHGGYLAALITYYGFLSLFPLLLLLVTALGYLLHGDPSLQQQVVHSALGQFPIVGSQLGRNVHAVHGSLAAVVVGVCGALYGTMGVGQAVQNALNVVWAVPQNSRPNPIKSRLRSLAVLPLLGLGLLATTGLSALTTSIHAYASGSITGLLVRVGSILLSVLINVLLFLAAFRLLTARPVSVAQVRDGALAAAIGWQVLQLLGTYFVGHTLKDSSEYYGVFGVVLGLLAFIYLAANLVVFCAEANAVRAQKLWPRSLLTPFTDAVSLTPGDEVAYRSYAAAQRRKGFQRIRSTFRRHRG